MAGEFPVDPDDTIEADDTNNSVPILQGVTTGEIISSGKVVYMNLADGEAYVSDNTVQNDRRADGIALTGAASGATIHIQGSGSIYVTSGLTPGVIYYLGTAGALSTTYSPVRVGRAISATALWLDIEDGRAAPVGSIVQVYKNLTGVPELTAYYQLMDGTTISDTESPMNGQTVRDVNANNEFLRGADTAGGNGGSATHLHNFDGWGVIAMENNTSNLGSYDSAAKYVRYSSWNSATGFAIVSSNSEPPYLNVVMAVKIK